MTAGISKDESNNDGFFDSMAPTKNDDSDSIAFQSLKKYVDILSSSSEDSASCQLVAVDMDQSIETEIQNATVTEVNTIVFRPKESSSSASSTYAVAIVPSSYKIDVSKLSQAFSDLSQEPHHESWELAPSHTVRNLCGFEPGTIPPLLVPPRKNFAGGHYQDDGMRRPFATILDSSLFWRNVTTAAINDSTANGLKRILLGGGGSTDHRCLIDLDFFVRDVLEIGNFTDHDDWNSCQSGTRNAKIASIVRFDGGITIGDAEKITLRHSPPATIKPFFHIAPPQNAIGSPSSGIPHSPVPITAIGRLTSVRQIAKKLVFADFFPPEYDYELWLTNKHAPTPNFNNNYDKDSETSLPGPPWRSGEDGKDMYVQIIVGKTFCERYEDGTNRLKTLKPGKLVLVRGAANVDPMQKNGWRNSAGNWAQKRSLDVIVSSLEILDEDDTDDSLRMLVEEAQREVASRGTSNGNWNSLLPWERKNDFERRAVAGTTTVNGEEKDLVGSLPFSNDDMKESANTLTLDRFNSNLRDDPLSIQIVDDDDSIKAMAEEISELFSRIDNDDSASSILDYVAGIDCEWRPHGAYTEALLGGPEDNPVALLQICLPAIGRAYLVDTHRTLRASLTDTEAMTETEAIFSEAIGAIFGSETMIKTGFSVGIDFRRLAASFPHMPCFLSVRSVVELSTLAERLHPKSDRPSLGSLQKMTKLVLGYNITKEEQCSNWEVRPLTQSQIEYATLDCALPPRLLDEMAEGSGTATIRNVLPGVTKSWRFQTINGSRKDAIRRLKAKRIVGNTFVVSQSWLNGTTEPDPTSIPEEGGGPYTDTDGLLKMPADLVRIGGKDAPWNSLSGKTVMGGKKSHCIDLLVGDAVPNDAILDYNPRSGFITFSDGLALFVNMPDPVRPSRRRMPYPNEWLEDGRFLTWYIRRNDWENGNSEVAKLLLGSNDDDEENSTFTSSSVVLFVRVGSRDFVCCGSCTAFEADDTPSGATKSNKSLLKLNLRLNNWETMKDTTAFPQLLEALKPPPRKKDSKKFQQNPASFQKNLVQAIVDGNIIGAFDMALDALEVSPTERSILRGKNCVKTMLLTSNDPLALRAKEIIDTMTL